MDSRTDCCGLRRAVNFQLYVMVTPSHGAIIMVSGFEPCYTPTRTTMQVSNGTQIRPGAAHSMSITMESGSVGRFPTLFTMMLERSRWDTFPNSVQSMC